MDNITKGLIVGAIFGTVSIIPMMFMSNADKERAMVASFIDRFAIGFIIFNLNLPVAGLLKGGVIGLVLSLPSAIITKKYGPIIGLGVVGGIVCGLLAH